ncbi:DNA alkylation repair protein [soil metagenome]
MPAKQPVENESAFKHWINRDVLVRLSTEISEVYPAFDQKPFKALAKELEPLELKARIRVVREGLRERLPRDFTKAVKILVDSIRRGKLSGFALWPYTDFIQTYGLEHRKESLEALSNITELFTAEFGVRPFLSQDTDVTLAFLLQQARSSNEHLRRWASEGSRPRLPWGERLDVFIERPEKTLPILELLKNDEALYVRKSVANHLNDISKDHPELVVNTLKRWAKEAKSENAERIRWITHRALRTLIKKGDAEALSAVGVSSAPKVKISGFNVDKAMYKLGDRLNFGFELRSTTKKDQTIIVDYIIHFQKSNKTTSAKVFKLKRLELAGGASLEIAKAHHLKQVTTRVHYAGAHTIEIQVNGSVMARADWKLKIPGSPPF